MVRISILLGLLTAATLLSAVCPVHAQERPFYADGDGVTVASSRFTRLNGVGEGTHLGRFRLFAVAQVRFNNIVIRSISLTAANGDTLDLVVRADAAEFDPETGILIGAIEFDGGTGRFADATGAAWLVMQFDEQLQSFMFAIDGAIDY